MKVRCAIFASSLLVALWCVDTGGAVKCYDCMAPNANCIKTDETTKVIECTRCLVHTAYLGNETVSLMRFCTDHTVKVGCTEKNNLKNCYKECFKDLCNGSSHATTNLKQRSVVILSLTTLSALLCAVM